MPIIPLANLKDNRPPWSPFSEGGRIELSTEDRLAPSFSDAMEVYYLLSGRVRVLEGAQAMEVRPGDLLLIPPGTPHAIQKVYEPSSLIHFRGPLHPPFRSNGGKQGDLWTVPLSPFRPMPSPRRKGVAVAFDETKTFSPRLMGADVGGDVLLALNLSAVVPAQTDAIRHHCLKEGRAVAGLVLKFHDDYECEEFILNARLYRMAFVMRPHLVGTDADLATAGGRRTAQIIRRSWEPKLRVEAIRPVVRMPLRAWDISEVLELFRFLTLAPPASFGIILHAEGNEQEVARLVNLYFGPLHPWIAAIEYTNPDCHDFLESYLDANGFQGWLIRTC